MIEIGFFLFSAGIVDVSGSATVSVVPVLSRKAVWSEGGRRRMEQTTLMRDSFDPKHTVVSGKEEEEEEEEEERG